MKKSFKTFCLSAAIISLASCSLTETKQDSSNHSIASSASSVLLNDDSDYEDIQETAVNNETETNDNHDGSTNTAEPEPTADVQEKPSQHPEDSAEPAESESLYFVHVMTDSTSMYNYDTWEDYHQATLAFLDKLEDLKNEGLIVELKYEESTGQRAQLFTDVHVENTSKPGDYEGNSFCMIHGVNTTDFFLHADAYIDSIIEGTTFAQSDIDEGHNVAIYPAELRGVNYHPGDIVYLNVYTYLSSGNIDQQVSVPFTIIGIHEKESVIYIPLKSFESMSSYAISFFNENNYDYFSRGSDSRSRWNYYDMPLIGLRSKEDLQRLEEALSEYELFFEEI